MAKSFLSGQNSNKKKNNSTLPLRKIALVAGALAAALGLGLIAFMLQQSALRQNVQEEQPRGTAIRNIKPEGAIEKSQAQLFKGDYGAAQKILEDELASTEDERRAQELLIQQAVNAYNKKKYDESLVFAREAVSLIDNYQANSMAAQAAEAAGDFAAAESYYRATLAKLRTDHPLYDAKKDSLEADIQRVSEQNG